MYVLIVISVRTDGMAIRQCDKDVMDQQLNMQIGLYECDTLCIRKSMFTKCRLDPES